jgi:hypothetical protein
MMRMAGPLRRHACGVRAPILVIGATVALSGIATALLPLASLVGAPAIADAQPSTRIVPGASIGPARLGMTAAAAAAALGPSTSLGGTRRYGLTVDFDSGLIVRIGTSAPKYRTADGAGVGIAAAQAPGLVGDVNSVMTTSGPNTTVVYMFQGIGFVFRGGRAVETFVVGSLPFGQPRASTVSVPGGPSIQVPGGTPMPPAAPSGAAMAAPPRGPSTGGSTQAAGPASAGLRDVTANVLSLGGLSVAGTLVNTGTVPIGPVTVAATFTRASGDQVDAQTIVPGPIAPGGTAPFLVQTAMVADIIIRYQVSATAAGGTLLAATGPESVPESAYAEFARRQIHIRVDLGAPSNTTGPPAVQAIVSVADTGVIPPQWVQQVTVVLPYTANGVVASQTVLLHPGQQQTVLVPAPPAIGQPQVTGVVLSGQ